MKIRNFMVSNSSSSSFIMVGVEVELEDLVKKVKSLDLSEKDREDLENDPDADLYYYVENIIDEKFGLSFIIDSDASNSVILGKKIVSRFEESCGGSVDVPKLMTELEPIISKLSDSKNIKLFYGNESC